MSSAGTARARASSPVITPIYVSGARRLRLAVNRVAFVLAIVFTVRYFFWRALHTMNPAAWIFFYVFLIAEILIFILRSEHFNLLKMHVLMRTLSGLFQKDSLFFVTRKARARAARASGVLLPLFLVVALLLALGAGMIRIQQRAWGGFYFWELAVNIFWAVVFVVMMGGVVRRSLQHKEQRVSYRSATKAAAGRLSATSSASSALVGRRQRMKAQASASS